MLLAGVVPHGVDSEAGLEPLLGGGHLPGADPAVQVPAQVQRHLGTLVFRHNSYRMSITES